VRGTNKILLSYTCESGQCHIFPRQFSIQVRFESKLAVLKSYARLKEAGIP